MTILHCSIDELMQFRHLGQLREKKDRSSVYVIKMDVFCKYDSKAA